MSPNWPVWHGTGCYQVEREIGGQGEAGRQSQVLSCLLTGPSGMALDVTRLRERDWWAGGSWETISSVIMSPNWPLWHGTGCYHRLRERLVGRGKLGDNLKCYHVS